jgi:hypothetical protein
MVGKTHGKEHKHKAKRVERFDAMATKDLTA